MEYLADLASDFDSDSPAHEHEPLSDEEDYTNDV